MKVCQIIGAGDFSKKLFEKYESSFMIAADKGFLNLSLCGVSPDLIVGDFDSLGYVPDFPNTVKLPVEKDETDTAFAIKEGLKRDCELFLLYGMLGGRLDHSLSNLQLLSFLSKQGKKAYIIDENVTVTAITNSKIHFYEKSAGIISVFALSENANGVTVKGLKFPLNNAVLTSDCPIGVSNEFIGQKSLISVTDGTLTVLWQGPLDNCASL